jgi:uncharacterized membrane protein YczE
MKKPIFYTEISYILGIITLALGASLFVKANYGVSVVVSPTYLLHLKLSETWSFATFGFAEYIVQGLLLILLAVSVRRFHWSYLFSFATALLYGFVLDRILSLFTLFTLPDPWMRIVCYILGLLICALGVSLCLHTYLSPEVYELFVKEVSAKYNRHLGVVKTIYDCTSLLLALILSISFFGFFPLRGIGLGTLISALLNGRLISWINRFLEKHFTFQAAFPKFDHYFAPPPFPESVASEPSSLE